MKKIKNKIIKMLGGITLEEHTKEMEIAFLKGKQARCIDIETYIINNYAHTSKRDYGKLILNTFTYVYDIYNETKLKIMDLKGIK